MLLQLIPIEAFVLVASAVFVVGHAIRRAFEARGRAAPLAEAGDLGLQKQKNGLREQGSLG
jgi:hypothetical protein